MPSVTRLSSILPWMLLLATVGGAEGLRCYVCGGHSGTPCRGGVGDTTALDTDTERQDQDPVQECTDLINNRGCVKQFVNGVVLLRGCWLDGSNKCLKNGAAEVCTCSRDLCNSATRTWDRLATTSVVLSVMVAVLL